MKMSHLKTRLWLPPILAAAIGFIIYTACGEVEVRRILATLRGFPNPMAFIGTFGLVVFGLYLYFGSRAWAVVVEQRQRDVTEEAVRLSKEKFLAEMRESENALRSEEQKFRALVEESPLGVALIGPDGRYKYINPKFADMFGYDRTDIPDGRNWFQKAFPDPEYRRKVIRSWFEDLKAYNIGESRPRTFTVTCKDGSEKHINFRPVVINTGDQILTYEDITEKSRLEAQFYQAQRMESIGTLAGGIAHDFNNLLMGIQGRTSMMLTDPVCPPSFFEHLRGVEDYVKSAADLTRRLLEFARGGKYETRVIDLNELIQHQKRMFGRTRKEIRIVEDLQEGLWAAEADRGQIDQVILNLYVNAWQAMPGGGDLTVRTENFTVDPKRFSRPFAVKPGDYVRISVTDTGIGMDDATLRRVFEPFFTTKTMGRGTGLGLASVYGIVKNHGGFIDVLSEKGKGSTFDIYLPASHKPVPDKKAATHRLRGIEPGRGTVLLVDDEVMILTVAEQMVKRLGYTVVTAPGGKEAVDLYRRRHAEIDMVILDMVMQGMGGGETFDRLKQINDRVKVILSSGYSIDGRAAEIMSRGCNGFIQKPFNMSELSQKIKAVMAPSSPGRKPEEAGRCDTAAEALQNG